MAAEKIGSKHDHVHQNPLPHELIEGAICRSAADHLLPPWNPGLGEGCRPPSIARLRQCWAQTRHYASRLKGATRRTRYTYYIHSSPKLLSHLFSDEERRRQRIGIGLCGTLERLSRLEWWERGKKVFSADERWRRGFEN